MDIELNCKAVNTEYSHGSLKVLAEEVTVKHDSIIKIIKSMYAEDVLDILPLEEIKEYLSNRS